MSTPPRTLPSPAAQIGFAHAPATLRFGLKGVAATAWLDRHGIAFPARANSIARWPQGRCLRLGLGEFLIELDLPHARPVVPETAPGEEAWTLLRSDHSVLLTGEHWPALLSQVCSCDFARLAAAPDRVVMTLLADISVILAPEPARDGTPGFALRLWCDASYADYLDHCLHSLAAPRLHGDPA